MRFSAAGEEYLASFQDFPESYGKEWMIGILVPHWPASAAARAAAHTVVPSLHDASEVISLLLAPAGMTH